jgi:FdhD protein
LVGGLVGSGLALGLGTGGLHGAGVFDAAGNALAVREDIGRHNAVDKVLGWALMNSISPAALVVSSRASFEIVQKAAASAVPFVVTVSAPSTLAIDLAESAGITLVAFARNGRATAYANPQRMA